MIGPSRRDFVAMLLGAPVAAAVGCRAQPRAVEGARIDTGMARGHARIRDAGAQKVRIPDDRWRRAEVVIVGAGPAGLAAAWQLARDGVRDVLVLELDDELGGTSRSGITDVTAHPWGAHYIVAPSADHPDLVSLLDEMAWDVGLACGGNIDVFVEPLTEAAADTTARDAAAKRS